MRSLCLTLLVIVLLSGCKKDKSYFAWEKSYGVGEARYIKVTSDSGLIACGVSENQPYMLRLDENKMVVIDYRAEVTGVFTSAMYDTSGYITAGSTEGKMLLMRLSKTGNKTWEKIIDPGFNIDQTQLLSLDDGNFLAIGSASPDTIFESQAGLLFIKFDSTGLVLNELEYESGFFIASYEAAIDNSDNIYLALTRKEDLEEPKATVAKFNSSLQRIWELELSNNPAYGAASMSIRYDESGRLFVAGRSELPTEGGGLINNSFIASISLTGSLNWKKYPENSNTGRGILMNSAGEVVLLNKNCFIINLLDPDNGADGGRIRMFDVCDPYNTDAVASDFDIDFNNDLVLAGSIGNSFYIAVKAIE
ncbi:MAG TPA: hypothetical protein VMV47_13120 [Bacteroidales bacterium]|nr:hypothetical protein [Bacteroidales bacterium]